MEIIGSPTADIAKKYDIKPVTLRKAIKRGEFPTTLVAGRNHFIDDTTPEFQSWLVRCRKRIEELKHPSAATLQSKERRQRHYREVIKPERARIRREEAQTS